MLQSFTEILRHLVQVT